MVTQRAARRTNVGVAVGLAVATFVGALVSLGPPWSYILLALVAATVGGTLLYRLAGPTVFAVELPLILLTTSQTVWRIRSSTSLADNPLDAAGTFRTGQVLVAGLLGLVALLQHRERADRAPLPAAWWLYGAYIVVVFLGAPLSANVPLTAYRGVELAVGLVVLLGARRAAPDGLARVEAFLYWSTVAVIIGVWAGVVLFPGLAVGHLVNAPVPIPLQIQGVFPVVSANSVGTSGVLLIFWTIGRAPYRWPGRRLRPTLLVLLGLASLLGAQYRTGYVMLAVGAVALLALRRRWALLLVLGVLLGCLLAYKPSLINSAEPYVLRGQTIEQAKTLNSRVDWWTAALPAWKEAPLVGKGLLTGTRFEVLPRLGLTETSSIHGTWVEALVGTGAIGCGLLAIAYLTALSRSIRACDQFAVLLLALIGVRSTTGSTIESFSAVGLLFLIAALGPSRWEASSSPEGSLAARIF